MPRMCLHIVYFENYTDAAGRALDQLFSVENPHNVAAHLKPPHTVLRHSMQLLFIKNLNMLLQDCQRGQSIFVK